MKKENNNHLEAEVIKELISSTPTLQKAIDEAKIEFMSMGHHPDCFYEIKEMCDCDMTRKWEFIKGLCEFIASLARD